MPHIDANQGPFLKEVVPGSAGAHVSFPRGAQPGRYCAPADPDSPLHLVLHLVLTLGSAMGYNDAIRRNRVVISPEVRDLVLWAWAECMSLSLRLRKEGRTEFSGAPTSYGNYVQTDPYMLAFLGKTNLRAYALEYVRARKYVETAIPPGMRRVDLEKAVNAILWSDIANHLKYMGDRGYTLQDHVVIRSISNMMVRHAIQIEQLFEPEGDVELKKHKIKFVESYGGWGSMTVHHAEMTLPVDTAKMGKRYQPAYIGPLRYIHRAILPSGDGMCFTIKKRMPGGALLIDCSGSMGLPTEFIVKLLEARPAMVVGMYASDRHTTGSGILLVVSEKLRRASAEEVITKRRQLMGAGNIVDGPALQWLGTQTGPRVWYSDGQVTGRHESQGQALLDDAEALCIKHRIKRTDTEEELDWMLGGACH